MTAAALYIRLSREDDRDGPSESITNQQALLEQFAAEQQFPICGTYIDDGWSGTSFDRPAFRRLLHDIEAGTVDLVLTKDLSRLGRDYIGIGHYLERYFPEHGVRYISLLDGIDTGTDAVSNEITPFRAVLNDLYAKDISKKIKSVKRDKQQRGLFIGGKALYGYRMDPEQPGHLLPDQRAAETVKKIFSLAAGGMSCRAIAEVLNRQHQPSPAAYAGRCCGSGQWSGERISDMLQNETYLGNLVQGRVVKISYKSKKRLRLPKDQWTVVEHTHQPLVDRETFDAVQQLLDSRRHTRCRTYDTLLKGMLFCRECGHPLGVINRKAAGGADCLYVLCRTWQRAPKEQRCTSHLIREDRVREAVICAMEALCGPFLQPERLQAEAEALIQSVQKAAGQPQAELQHQIRQQTAAMDRIYSDHLAGILPDADFQRLYTAAKGRRTDLERQLALQTVRPAPDPAALAEQFCREACQSRSFLSALLTRAELDQSRILTLQLRCARPDGISVSPSGCSS